MGITKDGRGRPSRAFILSQVDLGMTDLARTGGLPSPDENEEIWRNIWFEEAHNSTAIEGNTLVLKQVRTLLGEGRTVGNKELCEYLDVEGYARAAQWVYGQAQSNEGWHDDTVTKTELREIHRLAVGLAWLSYAYGRFAFYYYLLAPAAARYLPILPGTLAIVRAGAPVFLICARHPATANTATPIWPVAASTTPSAVPAICG